MPISSGYIAGTSESDSRDWSVTIFRQLAEILPSASMQLLESGGMTVKTGRTIGRNIIVQTLLQFFCHVDYVPLVHSDCLPPKINAPLTILTRPSLSLTSVLISPAAVLLVRPKFLVPHLD